MRGYRVILVLFNHGANYTDKIQIVPPQIILLHVFKNKNNNTFWWRGVGYWAQKGFWRLTVLLAV